MDVFGVWKTRDQNSQVIIDFKRMNNGGKQLGVMQQSLEVFGKRAQYDMKSHANYPRTKVFFDFSIIIKKNFFLEPLGDITVGF